MRDLEQLIDKVAGALAYQIAEKGLTSKQLANMAEITPSMLSQIERGSANPSIQTLKVLAKAEILHGLLPTLAMLCHRPPVGPWGQSA